MRSGANSTTPTWTLPICRRCFSLISLFFLGMSCRPTLKASTSDAVEDGGRIFVAQRVGYLHCIDPSAAALDVARQNLQMHSKLRLPLRICGRDPSCRQFCRFWLLPRRSSSHTKYAAGNCGIRAQVKVRHPFADLRILRVRKIVLFGFERSGESPIWFADSSAPFHSLSGLFFAT